MDTKSKGGAAGDAAPTLMHARDSEQQFDITQADILHAAMAYSRLGLRALPVVGKRPALRGWQDLASTDPRRLGETFARAPYADGIAIATGGGVFVVDLDRHRPDADGVSSFESFVGAHGPIPSGPRARTPSNGVHLYFVAPPGAQIRNAVSIAPGVDVRGDGGLACVPPTARRDGTAYRWTRSPWDVAMPPAPEWLLKIVIARSVPAATPRQIREISGDLTAYAAGALRKEVEAVALSAPGTRNSTLFRAAAALGELAGAGIVPVQAIEDALSDAACACGLLDDDGPIAVARTITSGLKRGLANPRIIKGGGR